MGSWRWSSYRRIDPAAGSRERVQPIYLIHAVLGGILTLVAMWLVTVSPRQRIVRAGIVIGLAGLVLGAAGGILAVYQASRFAGLALMFVGTLVAFFGYLLPLIEPDPEVAIRVIGQELDGSPEGFPGPVGKSRRWQMNGRSSSTTAGASTSG